MTGTELVLFGIFPRPYQISQSFMRSVRDPYRREISGSMLDKVAPYQKYSFMPSCRLRGSQVEVTAPKLLAENEVLTLLNWV